MDAIDGLNVLCYHIFDDTTPHGSEFVSIGNNLDEVAILTHPKLQCNILFQKAWFALYGAIPSTTDFGMFVAVHGVPHNVDVILLGVLKASFLGEVGMIGIPNQDALLLSLNTLRDSLKDPFVVKTKLYEKWSMRFGKSGKAPVNTGIVHVFIDHWKQSQAEDATINAKFIQLNHINSLDMRKHNQFVVSPFTSMMTEVPANLILHKKAATSKDVLRYCTFHNTNMLIKMVASLCVVIDMDIDDIDMISTMLANLSECSDKKLIVLTHKGLPDAIKSKEKYIQWRIVYELWDSIPRLAKWCLVVSNKLANVLPPLAAHKHDNVLLWCNQHAPPPHCQDSKYDRIISFNPQHTGCMCLANTSYDWKQHTIHSSPHNRFVSTQQNSLLFTDFMARYQSRHGCRIDTSFASAHAKKSQHVVMLVDNRKNIMSVAAVKISVMNTGWNAVVITSKDAISFYQNHLQGAHIIHDATLDTSLFDIDMYNDIMENPGTWRKLMDMGYNGHVLIVQDDGMLIRPGINDFLKYDYVGAPWADDSRNTYIKEHITPNLVGNGGFSLRRIVTMYNIANEHTNETNELFYHNLNRIPEDVFFIKHMSKKQSRYVIAPFNEACRFAVEQVIPQHIKCLGFHKMWCYHMPDVVARFFLDILEG